MTEPRTRRTRPVATQNPNLPQWVIVHDTGKDGYLARFFFNLTPAAAEDLGNELLQVAATARAESNRDSKLEHA